MTDEIKNEDTPTVAVTVVANGHGEAGLPRMIQTAGHLPDLVITVVGPIRAITIRFLNTYLTMIVGLIGAGLTDSNLIPASDFFHLVLKCAGLAIAGAGFGLLKDLVTIFSGLESKYPLKTGNV